MLTLEFFLILSAAVFAIGMLTVLTRRNAILILIGIELMLGSANINFIAFWRFGENPEMLTGVLFVMFAIAVAAAEAAVGLALILLVARRYRSTDPLHFNLIRG